MKFVLVRVMLDALNSKLMLAIDVSFLFGINRMTSRCLPKPIIL